MNFEKWKVHPFITLLPTLLHLAVFLFLAGLSVFLHPLNKDMEYCVLGFTVVTGAFYLVTLFLPVFLPQLPYRLPLLEILIVPTCQLGFVALLTLPKFVLYPFDRVYQNTHYDSLFYVARQARRLNKWLQEKISLRIPKRMPIGHAHEQDTTVSKDPDYAVNTATAAFSWLSEVTSNQSVPNMLLEVATCCYIPGQYWIGLQSSIPENLSALAGDQATRVLRDIRRAVLLRLNGDRVFWSDAEYTFLGGSNGMSPSARCHVACPLLACLPGVPSAQVVIASKNLEL